jgi:hypothetical protein
MNQRINDIKFNEILRHNSIKTMDTMGVAVKQGEGKLGRRIVSIAGRKAPSSTTSGG